LARFNYLTRVCAMSNRQRKGTPMSDKECQKKEENREELVGKEKKGYGSTKAGNSRREARRHGTWALQSGNRGREEDHSSQQKGRVKRGVAKQEMYQPR